MADEIEIGGSEGAAQSVQYEENVLEPRDHAQLIRDALKNNGNLLQDLVLSYDVNYRRHLIQSVAEQLSRPIPQTILHAVLSANIMILSNCGELTLDMVSVLHNSGGLTLKHLGMAYYAMGNNPSRYVVIEIVRTMAVKYPDLDISGDDSSILLDVLLDFTEGPREEGVDADERREEALIALRDLCGNHENNREAAAAKGAVKVLVEIIREDRYSWTAIVGEANVCLAALEALCFLLQSPKGQAAFVYHNTSFHALQDLIGTTSTAITHSAVTCLITVFHNLPENLQILFNPVLDPQTRPDTPFYSVLDWDRLDSVPRVHDDDYPPNDEDTVLALLNQHS